MSEQKEEGTGELEDEQLSEVSGGQQPGPPTVTGGAGIAGSTESQPGPPTVTEAGIASPRDPASGLPTGQRMHKPMIITK